MVLNLDLGHLWPPWALSVFLCWELLTPDFFVWGWAPRRGGISGACCASKRWHELKY